MYNKQRGVRHDMFMQNDEDSAIELNMMRRYGNEQSKENGGEVNFFNSASLVSSVRRLATLPYHLGVEAALLVGVVPDDAPGAVRLHQRVFTLHGIPIASLELVLLVPGFGVCHAIPELVFCWGRLKEKYAG